MSLLVIHLVSLASYTYGKLLAEFPNIVHPTFKVLKAMHGVNNFIPFSGPPVHARARRLPPEQLRVAREEFRKVEDLGIIRRSDR